MRINQTEIQVIKGDITEAKVDAIVNAASTDLKMTNGVALAIKKKGGQQIEDEALKKAPCQLGDAVETKAGKLPYRSIIHAVRMSDTVASDETIVRNACRNSIKLAQKLGVNSIAFPALGCGCAGFPAKASAKIMAQEALRHAKYDPKPLKEIQFVLFDDETYKVFEKNVISYLEYIQFKLSQGPFITVDIIIEVEGGIVLIERSNPPYGWAIPGGFLDYGETLEQCATREAKEETNLDVTDLIQMHTYSDPKRDPRFHTVTTVFAAQAQGKLKAGDDAQNARIVPLDEALTLKLAFDHANVLADYKKFRQKPR